MVCVRTQQNVWSSGLEEQNLFFDWDYEQERTMKINGQLFAQPCLVPLMRASLEAWPFESEWKHSIKLDSHWIFGSRDLEARFDVCDWHFSSKSRQGAEYNFEHVLLNYRALLIADVLLLTLTH